MPDQNQTFTDSDFAGLTADPDALRGIEPVPYTRTAFEKWIAKDGGDLSTFGSGVHMHYRNSAVNTAWGGWRARELHAALPAPMDGDAIGAGRHAFEFWVRDLGISTTRSEKNAALYAEAQCQAMWWAWQAGRAGLVMAPSPTAAQQPGPVTQQWVHAIPMMQQSVLLAAVRGPDGLPKYGGGAKMLLRFYRRCILLSALDQRVLADPIEPNGGSFTGPSLDGPDDVDHWTDRMQVHVNDYLRQLDALPHHWQMHFMHAVEIVGYKHPDATTRHFWHQVYLRLVHDMHVWPETEQQLDDRLGDTRSGWLRRADPATTA